MAAFLKTKFGLLRISSFVKYFLFCSFYYKRTLSNACYSVLKLRKKLELHLLKNREIFRIKRNTSGIDTSKFLLIFLSWSFPVWFSL